jgi:GLPGLI family protein
MTIAPLLGFSQTEIGKDFKYKATYELTYQPDSTDVNSIKSESMILYLGDKISRFSSLGTVVGDSLMKHRDKSNKNMAAFARLRSQIPKTDFDYYIYKGIPENKLSYTQEIVKDNYRVIEDLAIFDWKIQPETKSINGFKSQKATTKFAGRDYTAWFTSEIPILDGPYKFNGLPGLILEISDRKNHYSFVLTEFEKLRKPIPFKFTPNDYLLTKKDELLNIYDEYMSNPFAALGRQGITLDFQPGQKEKMMKEHREELKKKNNPIELE